MPMHVACRQRGHRPTCSIELRDGDHRHGCDTPPEVPMGEAVQRVVRLERFVLR